MLRFPIDGTPKRLVALLLGLFLMSCSQAAVQSQKGTAESLPAPDCLRNCSEESRMSSGSAYRTWVKYDNIGYNKAFDSAVVSLEKSGHRVILSDRESGQIRGERIVKTAKEKPYPMDVQVTGDASSLVVHASLKASGGNADRATLCQFYEEFEKLIRQASTSPPPAEAPKSSPGVTPKSVTPPHAPTQQEVKPPAPSMETKPKPAPPTRPLTSSSSSTLRTTEVAWSSVNLREGPGMSYKVVGTAKKGTPLRVLGENGSWLKVRLEDGKEVWVSKSATPEAPKPSPPSSPPTKRAPSKPVSPM